MNAALIRFGVLPGGDRTRVTLEVLDAASCYRY
jgi:hypothetical protein